MDRSTERFVQELSREVQQALEMVRVRMSVEDAKKTFAPANVISALYLITLDYALTQGISAEQFIRAMRAVADRLEIEFQTKTGIFAPRAT